MDIEFEFSFEEDGFMIYVKKIIKYQIHLLYLIG